MSTTQPSPKPAYRIAFAKKNGTNGKGKDQLSYPREIGAAWTRKDESKGLILDFDVIPANMSEGVILLLPVTERSADTQDQLV